AGLVRGDWEFAHTGTACRGRSPQRQRSRDSGDAYIGVSNVLCYDEERDHSTGTARRKESRSADQYRTDSIATWITIEKAGATAVYLPLIKFERIYDALASGEIDAGALPIDLRFSGQVRYGWNAFPMSSFDTPSIFDDHAEVDRFQPRACDERYARFRRDDPFVQDPTGDCPPS